MGSRPGLGRRPGDFPVRGGGNTPELVSVWCWLSVTVDIPILFACWWNRRGKRFRERRDGKLVEVGPAFDF